MAAARYNGRGGTAFHPITHGLLGWAIAHAGPESRPARFWCLVASLIPDLDGLSLVGGVEAFQRWHHILAHNLLFCATVVLVSARWIGFRPYLLTLVALSFLSHLAGDYVGSGPDWSLHPFLPFNNAEFLCPFAWPLASWQNALITIVLGAIAIAIALIKGRTPLEFAHAGLDRSVVDTLRLRRWTKPCSACTGQARGHCEGCGQPLCPDHIKGWKGFTPRCAACLSPSAP